MIRTVVLFAFVTCLPTWAQPPKSDNETPWPNYVEQKDWPVLFDGKATGQSQTVCFEVDESATGKAQLSFSLSMKLEPKTQIRMKLDEKEFNPASPIGGMSYGSTIAAGKHVIVFTTRDPGVHVRIVAMVSTNSVGHIPSAIRACR